MIDCLEWRLGKAQDIDLGHSIAPERPSTDQLRPIHQELQGGGQPGFAGRPATTRRPSGGRLTSVTEMPPQRREINPGLSSAPINPGIDEIRADAQA
jgi:hypothetical protein